MGELALVRHGGDGRLARLCGMNAGNASAARNRGARVPNSLRSRHRGMERRK